MRPLLVDAKHAAWLLGIGRTTLYELIGAGAITPIHIGRCVRFAIADLERFVAHGCVVDIGSRSAPPPAPATAHARSTHRARPGGVTLRLFDPAG